MENTNSEATKQRIGSKYISEGVTLTDNLSNKKFKIVKINKDGLIISEIVSLGRGEETPISFEDLLNKFDNDQISIEGYEPTESDKIIFRQVINGIMSGHRLTERENELNELITEETEFKSGGVVGKIKYNKNGTVKEVKNQFGKIISEVQVGDITYRINPVYKTYNSVDKNELLRKEDVDKIKIAKRGIKVKEKDKDKEKELEESAKRIIEHEILAVQSALVEKLFSSDVLSYDEVQNAYHYRVDNKLTGGESYLTNDEFDEYKDKIQEKIDELENEDKDATEWQEHLDELENLESEPQEILEWWLISDWLKEKLLSEGEPILDSDYGTWWGRTTSGQQIIADGIIQKIVKKINLDKYAKGAKIKTAKTIPVDTSYQGWKNYETWNVKLWIDNEQGTQEYWNERAKEIAKSAKKSEYLTKKQEAAHNLADELKDYFDENNPLEGQASTYSDLLGSALQKVDWREISENLLSETFEYGGEVEVNEMEQGGKIRFPKGYKIEKNPNSTQATDLWIITYPDGKRFYDKGDIELDFETKEQAEKFIEKWGKKEDEGLMESGGEVGQEFHYLKLIPKENGLEIKLTKEGKKKLKEDGLTYSNVSDYFDDVQGNSEYLYHDDLGQDYLGMTGSEGITDGYHLSEDTYGRFETQFPESAKVYWFPNYQVQFWGDILKDDGSVFFLEAKESGGYMKKGGKVDITTNFYRFRQHSPKGVTECAVPQWAKHVAEATKKGAEITTCKKNGKWFVQSIMIPKDGINVSKARKLANEIKSKFARKKKALGGVAETCTSEDIEKTKNGLRVLIASSKNEAERKKHEKVLADLY